MSRNGSLGVAVVGAGRWGRNLVRNFSACQRAGLRWVCDADPKVRSALAAQHGARPGASIDEVLADAEVGAVVLATPAPSHAELAIQALRAGKHVYVEKPMALSAADAQAVVDAAGAADRKLMVGHLLEYHPAVDYLRAAVDRGDLGRLYYAYCHRLNLGVVRQDENAWWSLAPHDISVVCYLFDAEPVSVAAHGQCFLRPRVEDVVFAVLRFADGRVAHVHVSWLDPHKIRKITLVGTDKMITFDDMEASEKIRVYDKGAVVQALDNYAQAVSLRVGDILLPKLPAAEPLAVECQHFVDAVLDDRPIRSDGADGLRVVKVLAAGAESLRQNGQPVAIDAGRARPDHGRPPRGAS